MKEVKKPRKSLLFYYVAIFVGLILFNLLAMPNITERKITEVDYGTFMSMTADKNIGLVEIQQNRIVFTDKEQKNIYATKKYFLYLQRYSLMRMRIPSEAPLRM